MNDENTQPAQRKDCDICGNELEEGQKGAHPDCREKQPGFNF